MTDAQIVELYWKREETAVEETRKKYGTYLYRIAYGVLANPEDCEEVVNDTYLRAWNAMPPHRPVVLSTFLGKLVRRASIDLFRTHRRAKRGGSEYELSLSELEDCVAAGDRTEQSVELQVLANAIDAYLHTISAPARVLFVRRYYFMDSLQEAARRCGMSASRAASLLYHTRLGLKDHLKKEGFSL